MGKIDAEKNNVAISILKKLYLYAGKDWGSAEYRIIQKLESEWEEIYDRDFWYYVCEVKQYTEYSGNGDVYSFTEKFLQQLENQIE